MIFLLSSKFRFLEILLFLFIYFCLLLFRDSFRLESIGTQLLGIQGVLKMLLKWTMSFKNKLVDDFFEHSHYSLDGPNCLKQLKVPRFVFSFMAKFFNF